MNNLHQTAHHCVQHADVKLLEAALAIEEEVRAFLLDEARDHLMRAESLQPGSGAWRMACLSARQGRAPLCQQWLQRAHKYGALPARDEVESCSDLALVRHEEWFVAIVNNL
jgi:hypothetical protein